MPIELVTNPKQSVSEFLAGSMKFIIFAFSFILILSFFLWGVNKQIENLKNDLRVQGQLKGQVQQLTETANRLDKELSNLTKSNELTQQSVSDLKQKNAEIAKVTKVRADSVQKQITGLLADTTLSPLAKEKAISDVYAKALENNQCRILPALCAKTK